MDIIANETYSIIINSTKENKQYIALKNAIEIEKKSNSEFLTKISIFENNEPYKKDEFTIYIYSPTGQLITKLDKFTNIDEIKQKIVNLNNKNPSDVKQKGGSSSYKHKYEKYKKKYIEMQGIITHFN
jgi:hypothetical protein